LLHWILSQPSPNKEVLLQVFSGTPEGECAANLGLPLVQVKDIVQAAADDKLTFAEDNYVMSYFAAQDEAEFCRKTRQSAGVYKLLSLRFHKSHQSGSVRPATSNLTPDTTVAHVHAASTRTTKPASKKASSTKRSSTRKPAASKAAAASVPPEPQKPKVLTEEEKAAAEQRRLERQALRNRARSTRFD
jgi:hypothetical protein